MTTQSEPFWRAWGIPLTWLQMTVVIAALITAARLIVNAFTPYNLGPDEAQYWSWSRDLAWGYFSKPPMIAWSIAATTSVCGPSEACVRLGSPLFHMGTAIALFVLGRMMFSAWVGFFAALAYITLPAVWLSSGIVSTDVPLLFFWSLGLIFLWKTLETKDWRWAVLTGLAVGFGMLSKYAMIYFLVGMIAFALLDKRSRGFLISPRFAIVMGLLALFLVPNILWNLNNDFATVSHTAANASWGGELFNPDQMLRFIGEQFGVFGPIMFGTLLVGGFFFIRAWLRGARVAADGITAADAETWRRDLYLFCFTLPPLLVVSVQAFISRANANWAATAYVAATVLVIAWLSRVKWRALAPASVGLHTALGVVFLAMVLSPAFVETLGRGNDFKRVTGWDDLGAEVSRRATAGTEQGPFTAVMVNDRLAYGELLYYAPNLPAPLVMWDANGVPENHFELNNPLTEELGGRVLLSTESKRAHKIIARAESAQELGVFVQDIGGGRTRKTRFYVLTNLKPVAPDEAAAGEEEPAPSE